MNHNLKLAACLALATLPTCITQAATPQQSAALTSLTLQTALQLALERNPTLRAADGRVRAAQGDAELAGRWENPELELSAEEWPLDTSAGFSDAKQTIGLVQTVPFPGKKDLDRRLGRVGTMLSRSQLELTRRELVRDVTIAFLTALTTERMVEVAEELVEVAEASAETARKRVNAGATEFQEQLRAEIQTEQAGATRIRFERDRAEARRYLATLLGHPELAETPLVGTVPSAAEEELLQVDAAAPAVDHPGILAARSNLDRYRLEERQSRLATYPDLRVGLAGGRWGETDQSIIELKFSLPLPLLNRGNRKGARAKVDVAASEMDAVGLRLEREWKDALARYRAAIAQVTLYRERILPKATQALNLVQVGFKEGKFEVIDLLDTQRTSAEVRLAYHEKLLEMNVAHAQLRALLPEKSPDIPTTDTQP